MLIAVLGPPGSGKRSIADFLIQHLNFRQCYIHQLLPSPNHLHRSENNNHHNHSDIHNTSLDGLIQGNDNDNSLNDLIQGISISSDNDHQNQSLLQLCWRKDYHLVLLPPFSLQQIEDLRKRPFFIIISVTAKSALRYQRVCAKHGVRSIDQFVNFDDRVLYDMDEISNIAQSHSHLPTHPDSTSITTTSNIPSTLVTTTSNTSTTSTSVDLASHSYSHSHSTNAPNPTPATTLYETMRSAKLHVVNNFSHLQDLHDVLRTMDILHPQHIRPSWDLYFLRIACLAALRTNCMKRRVGAVIVKDNRLVATGYNGTPKGFTNCADGGCRRCNGFKLGKGRGLAQCMCLHAEENAIMEAGVARCNGATLYCNVFPCLGCSKKIVQVGIIKVIYATDYDSQVLCVQLFQSMGIVTQRIDTNFATF